MGDEDAVRTAIERIEHLLWATVRGAHQHWNATRPRRHDAQIDVAAIKRRVLGVDTDAVEAGVRQHLDNMRVRGLEEGAEQRFSGGNARFQVQHLTHHNRSLAIAAPSAKVASLA